MKIHPVAIRYARALFELSVESKTTDAVFSQVRAFSDLLQKEKSFQDYFFSPKVEKSQKFKALEELLKGKVSDLVYHFLELLIKKNRIEYFEQIVFNLEKLRDQKENRLNASITSVMALEDQQLAEINQSLSKSFKASIVLKNKVDPEILGGVILQVEGKIMDSSLLHQLELLKRDLLNTNMVA